MSIKEQRNNESHALLRTNSTPEITIRRNVSGKTLLNKRKATVEPLNSTKNATVFINKTFIEQEALNPNAEISAMSVASLYQSGDNLDAEMDTDRCVQHNLINTPLFKCNISVGTLFNDQRMYQKSKSDRVPVHSGGNSAKIR